MPKVYYPRFLYLAWLGIGLGLAAVGCGQAEVIPPEPTPSETPIPSLTPSVVWFPPTTTPTAFPTPVITPTIDIQPQAGDILLIDNFSSGEDWQIAQSNTSSVALGRDVITLALDQPGGYLYTLRSKPVLRDFYVQITASTSLCRAEDEYGLLFRVTPGLEFYRFSLSCDGRVRLDKYYQGRASSPRPWMSSGAVPPGSPGSIRIGVWAQGRNLQFYINGELQFSISDPSLSAGTMGLFIRSAGDTAVTVSFSELVIQSIP